MSEDNERMLRALESISHEVADLKAVTHQNQTQQAMQVDAMQKLTNAIEVRMMSLSGLLERLTLAVEEGVAQVNWQNQHPLVVTEQKMDFGHLQSNVNDMMKASTNKSVKSDDLLNQAFGYAAQDMAKPQSDAADAIRYSTEAYRNWQQKALDISKKS